MKKINYVTSPLGYKVQDGERTVDMYPVPWLSVSATQRLSSKAQEVLNDSYLAQAKGSASEYRQERDGKDPAEVWDFEL